MKLRKLKRIRQEMHGYGYGQSWRTPHICGLTRYERQFGGTSMRCSMYYGPIWK